MKRLTVFLTMLMFAFSLFASTAAEAKRFGGGSSFGKQRAVPMQPQRSPDATPRPAPNQPQQGNKWLGPLAGLAAGAAIGSLLAGHGMGGAMGSILMMVLVGAVLLFLISRFMRPRNATPAGPYGFERASPQPVTPQSGYSNGGASAQPQAIPADFPVDSFLRGAKASFIRLQAANDRKDLDDIREYTTPEMFAEISMQIHERDDTPQKTDVVWVNAELIEVASEGDYSVASVRFTAQLRENGQPPEDIDEIWHVQRDLRREQAGWLLAGIQQTPRF